MTINIPIPNAWKSQSKQMETIEVEIPDGTGSYIFSNDPPEDTTLLWVDTSVNGKFSLKVYNESVGWKNATPAISASNDADGLGISVDVLDYALRVGLNINGLLSTANNIPTLAATIPIYNPDTGFNEKVILNIAKNFTPRLPVQSALNPNAPSTIYGLYEITMDASDVEINLGDPDRAEVKLNPFIGITFKYIVVNPSNTSTSDIVFKNGAVELLRVKGLNGSVIEAIAEPGFWRINVNNNSELVRLSSTAATGQTILGTLSNGVQNLKQLTAGSNITLTPSGDTIEIAASGGGSAPVMVTNADFVNNYTGGGGGSYYQIETDEDYVFILGGDAGGGTNPNIMHIVINNTLTMSVGRTITVVNGRNTTDGAKLVYFRTRNSAGSSGNHMVVTGGTTIGQDFVCPAAQANSRAVFTLTNLIFNPGAKTVFIGNWIAQS